MPSSTPIYGLPYPLGTDPVGQGAQDIEDLATAVETTLSTTMGMTVVGSGTFTNVGFVDITGFSSTYKLYDLTFLFERASAGGTAISAQIRSGSTARTGYYGGQYSVAFNGTVGAVNTANNATSITLTAAVQTLGGLLHATIENDSNQGFNMLVHTYDSNSSRSTFGGYSNYANPNDYDNIRISGVSANITGRWVLCGKFI